MEERVPRFDENHVGHLVQRFGDCRSGISATHYHYDGHEAHSLLYNGIWPPTLAPVTIPVNLSPNFGIGYTSPIPSSFVRTFLTRFL
ncbi:hypothetical protein GCM10027436_24160 [Actinophytocola sediminis]